LLKVCEIFTKYSIVHKTQKRLS